MLLRPSAAPAGSRSVSRIVLLAQWALPAMPATISPLYVVLSLALAVLIGASPACCRPAVPHASSRSTRCAPSDRGSQAWRSIAMWTVLRASLAAAVLAVAGLHAPFAAAGNGAMIGTGNVGAALGRRFAENGHKIVYGSRDPSAADVRELVAATGNGAVAVTQAEAAAQADIVVLAVPWSAGEDVVRALPICAARSSSTRRIRASWRVTASPTIRSRTRTPSESRAWRQALTSSKRSARSAPRRCSTPSSPAAP